ncbi:TNT domain-containing protein [Streptomyces lasiicapitis]|uniref:TNT domain-containing protein n=1 Tax=Streptomyces lasiicapitis TaxID=1923961 RepID=UPI00331AEC5C
MKNPISLRSPQRRASVVAGVIALATLFGPAAAHAAALDDLRTTTAATGAGSSATAPVDERPSATPPHVFGEPAPRSSGAPSAAAAAANRAPNTPKAPEVGPPFKQASGVWQTNTLTPTFRNTVVDPDKDKTTSTFEVWTAKADGTAGSKVNLTDDNKFDVLVSGFAASGTPASVTVPKGKLKDGSTYLVRSSAYDGSAYEADWSPWAKFKVAVPPVVPPGPITDGRDDVPADVKAQWQKLAKDALASYDKDQAELARIKSGGSIASGAAAVKQLNMNDVKLPDNGYFGVPRQFMAARVYDSRATDNPTVSMVGACEGALHCTQKFRLDYTLRVDTFYCTAQDAAANVGSKCPENELHWVGFSAEAQSEEFTREYNRITDGFDKFLDQMVGDLPKIFTQCVTGDTSTTEPPVVAAPRPPGVGVLRATADQCAEAGMQLGALLPLGRVGGAAKVTSDPLVEVNFTAAQIAKAKGALNELKLAQGKNQYATALRDVIGAAVKADNTGGLSFTLKQVIDLPKITANMRPEPQKLMTGYKPMGNMTIEQWFHKFWDKDANWFKYPPQNGFEGAAKVHLPKVGDHMDRFGGPNGGFLAPRDGTPYTERALPPSNVSADASAKGPGYHAYRWARDWGPAEVAQYGNIQGGKIAPWFGQPGGGTQYLLPKGVNVQWLLDNRYIVEVTD